MLSKPSGRSFPCPVCGVLQSVCESKKAKPYLTCNVCGVQMFVRGKGGIAAFDRLLDRATAEGALARVTEMARRYHVTCGACDTQFWIEPKLIVTSVFDGSLKGVRCPNDDCEAVLPWKEVA
jgi:transcription elongation factor Elf1